MSINERDKSLMQITSRIYFTQKTKSVKRGHSAPLYSLEELRTWLYNDWLFLLLYDNWVNCGYISNMKPSLDRLDDDIGYSFSNVQIGTWEDNNKKNHNINKKSVIQLTKDGDYVNDFESLNEAASSTSIVRSNIGRCVNGKLKSAGGYLWIYK